MRLDRQDIPAEQQPIPPEPKLPISRAIILNVALRTLNRCADWIGARVKPASKLAPTLFDRLTSREVIANILLTNSTAGTLLLTYFGAADLLAENGAGIIQKGEALIFAITVAVLCWLGWFFLFGLVDRLRGRWLALAGAAALVFLSVVVAIDAPLNMRALAGASAVQHSLVRMSSAYEEAGQKTFARNAGIRRLVPAIQAQAERFKRLEEQERHGAQSGRVGPGKISAAFGQVATLLGELAKSLNSNLGQADTLQGDAAGLLATLKTQVYRQGPARERAAESAKLADQLDAVLGRLAQLDATISIKATLDAMDTMFPAATRGATAFETMQNAEVARIAEMVRPVAAALREALAADASTKDAVVLPHTRPADPMVAIFTDWQSFVPAWVAAIFVDVAPAILLVILIAGRREAERQERKNKGSAS